MQDTDFDPARAERLILRLRVENRQLKSRLREIPRLEAQGLPPSWEKKVRKLRVENARLRIERNEARGELAALRAQADV